MKSIQSGGLTFPAVDIRFYRRLVRDFYRREASPEFTFELWESVRENENKNIFPFTSLANININSTLCYEIGMLKPYLDEILPLVPDTSKYYYFRMRDGSPYAIFLLLIKLILLPIRYITSLSD